MTTGHDPDNATGSTRGVAWSVLRRGLARSPILRRGLLVSVGLGMSVAAARLISPIVLQLALDRGVLGDDGIRPGRVLGYALVGVGVIVVSSVLSFLLQRRLVTRAETAIAELRTSAFDHIHRLSIADHAESRRGALIARVTSDADGLGRFVEWGMLIWVIHPILIAGTFVVLAVYSWQLALIALVAYAPVVPLMRLAQQRMYRAHDQLRSDTATMLSAVGETIAGADTIRAYGAEDVVRRRVRRATGAAYRSQLRANRYMATVFVVGDVFGALALVSVLLGGIWFHESWGLTAGALTAALFLTTLVHDPIGELAETLEESQAAAAGWAKILDLLDREPDVGEPDDGVRLPAGALSVTASDVSFAYRDAEPVLHGVSCAIPAGATVAIVGATGSGKTTFARLLCRLADPASGTIELGGVALGQVAPASRLSAVRMVPQDGFLFDVSIRENIRLGRPGASDADVAAALAAVGLGRWPDRFPDGVDTRVGERGGQLSVGERQLVALARAALADPGLLILDEATSAVDPETDQAMTVALGRLARDRTVVSIAHRLATAEAADVVLVFDEGRLVQQGAHAELVARPGPYARLHESWIGATRT